MSKPRENDMVTKDGRKYTRMDELQLDEISAVDFPAQTPAKATILKRATPADETESQVQAIAKRVQLTMPADGHSHMVVTSTGFGELEAGETSWEDGHAHPWVRDSSGRVTLGMGNGHIHVMDSMAVTTKAAHPDKDDEEEDEDKEKPVGKQAGTDAETPEDGTTADPLAKADDSASTQPADELGDEAMTKKIEKDADVKSAPTQEEFDALTKRAERSEKVAELSDSQRAVYAKMSADEQDTFLALEPSAREAILSKAADADPVVYTTTDGIELRKSADPLMVILAKKADVTAKELGESKALLKAADLEKRADQFAHLPGTVESRIELLKAVDGIDADKREAVLEILKSKDLGLGDAFKKQGAAGAEVEGSPADKLDAMAKKHAADKGMAFSKAYTEVINTEAGLALYQEHINS